MTREAFEQLAANSILLDGATGSNLLAAGMPRGVCAEKWILNHPKAILSLQQAYVEAGSQIIYAPTFGGNRENLTRYGLQDDIRLINQQLVALAKEAAQGKALVAGDITTTGRMMDPLGDLTYEEAFAIYQEQISILAEAGADLIIGETMISIPEALAAADAARSVCSLPFLCTMTVDADGSIFTGGNAWEAAESLAYAGAAAVGVNCSVGPDQLPTVIRSIAQRVSLPVIAKPNAGMPSIDERGAAHYAMEPETFASHMRTLRQEGATILGGCCGTTPAFIRQLAKEID